MIPSSNNRKAQGIALPQLRDVHANQQHQLIPSNATMSTGSCIRRPLFRSQIPIRARFGPQAPSTSEEARARMLEQHLQSIMNPFSAPQTGGASGSSRVRLVMISLAKAETASHSIEKAFKVYGDRLQADLRDFRGLCTGFVVHEQHEKDKWYSLCMKIMRERDLARQRLHALVQECDARSMNSPAISPSSGQSSSEQRTSRGSKRGLEDSNSPGREDTSDISSRSTSFDPRPMCSLRASPIPSPPGSPSYPIYTARPLPPHPRSCSLPPSPTSTASAPPSSAASAPPSSAGSAPPSSAVSSASSAPSSRTTFGPDGAHQTSAEQRPVKRRKSCEASLPPHSGRSRNEIETQQDREARTLQNANGVSRTVKSQCRTSSPITGGKAPCPAATAKPARVIAPGEFSHVDLMYIPMKGALTCRACVLNKTKSASNLSEPKSFPMTASWDELRDHCVEEHPDACADVARLHPAEIFELRRRLNL